MNLIVTGGRGFIGSHFVEKALAEGDTIIDFDSMTYCAKENLPFDGNRNYTLIRKDICEITHLPACDAVVNFAAETHVDNSINDSKPFIHSNIIGVHTLLELIRGKREYERPLFVQISTDEVYGDRLDGKFTEQDKLQPSNPYSASKAAAEMLVLSYHRTYKMDYLLTRSSNNYGERQYEEKLIPKTINCILQNKNIPLHGDGSYVRDWIYVKDNVDAIYYLLKSGVKNDVYNIGANNYMTNLDVVKQLLRETKRNEDLIQFVENRWGQDLRYSVNTEKINKKGWNPKHTNGIFTNWMKS